MDDYTYDPEDMDELELEAPPEVEPELELEPEPEPEPEPEEPVNKPTYGHYVPKVAPVPKRWQQ